MEKKQISRRNFLNLSASLACTTAIQATPARLFAGAIENKGKNLRVLKGYKPKIDSIWVKNKEDKNPSKNPTGDQARDLKALIESASDFKWLSKGDRVLIKLAMNSGNMFPSTTDPFILDGLLVVLKEKGAGEIMVCDQSGVGHVQHSNTTKRGSSRQLCDSSGLLKVISDHKVSPVFFEEKSLDSFFGSVPEGNHNWKKPIQIPIAVRETDHIIYLPRVASHILADITSGFKIGVGFLRDDSRYELHRNGKEFYEMYEEINHIPEIKNKLRLTITSGRKVLSTFGPDKGHVSTPDYGLIMASEDLLANEVLSYAWLQWNRKFNTSNLAKATTGQLTKFRSGINKGMVWKMWDNDDEQKTSNIPMFMPGDIYDHPSIYNFMKRSGGKPEGILWQSINENPHRSVAEYIKKQINPDTV
jgi:uncharacterized protein (DUF362 family)